MKCKEIQKQENVNLQLKNKKKQRLKEKGITLIALVVTIIILLILAGVTLNMALSEDGLFSKARNAAEKYKKAQEDEVELISEIGKEMNSEYVGAFVTGYEPTNGTCIISKDISGIEIEDTNDVEGNNIEKDENGNQTFTTTAEGKLKWRIWDYDGSILRIILDRTTTQKLTLSNAEGYNNGVWAINEICRKCFGKYDGEKMKIGIEVANLKRSDIEKISTYDYTKYAHKYGENSEILFDGIEKEGIGHYGQQRKANDSHFAPRVWFINDSEWRLRDDYSSRGRSCCEFFEIEYKPSEDEERWECDNDTIFYETYVTHTYDKERDFYDGKYYDLLRDAGTVGSWFDKTCWLSTRDIFYNKNDKIGFSLDYFNSVSNTLCAHALYNSTDERKIVSFRFETDNFYKFGGKWI